MLSLLFGKRILSGTICLTTATSSIVVSTNCGGKKDTNSINVSWSEAKNGCYKITGEKTIAKSTEYICNIEVDINKCNFIVDNIHVNVSDNDDVKDIWPNIKGVNPKSLSDNKNYKLTIPAEEVKGNIYIDLTQACQLFATKSVVNYTIDEHCTINDSHQGKIEKVGACDIKLPIKIDDGYAVNVKGYYFTDTEKNKDISSEFEFYPKESKESRIKPNEIVIPKKLFISDNDPILVEINTYKFITFKYDVESDTDGSLVATTSDPIFVQSEEPKYKANICYKKGHIYDDSIFVYTNKDDTEKESGINITSSCQILCSDNTKRLVSINIPLKAIEESGNSIVYIAIKRSPSPIDVEKHFPILFQNNTTNASDKQVRTTWLTNVWGETQSHTDISADESIKQANKAWTYPTFDVTYQFTPLYETNIEDGNSSKSTIQYVLKDDSFNIYYTIVDDKDDNGELKHHPIENNKLIITRTFEDIGTKDDPDQLRSYKVVIPNLLSLFSSSDKKIEIGSCVISFSLEAKECYSLLDVIGDKNYVTVDPSAYNFISPSSEVNDFTIKLFLKEGYTIDQDHFDLYYINDKGDNVSFKNAKSDDGREIVCNHGFYKGDVVYIRIPISIIKWNFYLKAPHCEYSADDSYCITYNIDNNKCKIVCTNDDLIKDQTEGGFLIPKENPLPKELNFEIKFLNGSQLWSWDVLRYEGGIDGETNIVPFCQFVQDKESSNTYKLTIPCEQVKNWVIISVIALQRDKFEVVTTYPDDEKRKLDIQGLLDDEKTEYDKDVYASSLYSARFVFKRGYQLLCESTSGVVKINGKDITAQCQFERSTIEGGLVCTTLTIPVGLIDGNVEIHIDYEEMPKVNIIFLSNNNIQLLSENLTYYVGEEISIPMLIKNGSYNGCSAKFWADGSDLEDDKACVDISEKFDFFSGSNTNKDPAKLVLSKDNNIASGTIKIEINISDSTSPSKFLGFEGNKITYHDAYFDKSIDVSLSQKSNTEYVVSLPDEYKLFNALNIFVNDQNKNPFTFVPQFVVGNDNDFSKEFVYSIYEDIDRQQPLTNDHIKIINNLSIDLPMFIIARPTPYNIIDYIDISPVVDRDIHIMIPVCSWLNPNSPNLIPYSFQYCKTNASTESSLDWKDCNFDKVLNTFAWNYDFKNISNGICTMSITTMPGCFDVYKISPSKSGSTINSEITYSENPWYKNISVVKNTSKIDGEIKIDDKTYSSTYDLNSLRYTFSFSLNILSKCEDNSYIATLLVYARNNILCTRCDLIHFNKI